MAVLWLYFVCFQKGITYLTYCPGDWVRAHLSPDGCSPRMGRSASRTERRSISWWRSFQSCSAPRGSPRDSCQPGHNEIARGPIARASIDSAAEQRDLVGHLLESSCPSLRLVPLAVRRHDAASLMLGESVRGAQNAWSTENWVDDPFAGGKAC